MDLRSLLDVEVSEIKKPPTWPAGAYHGHIEKYEPGESREKKTPYLRLFVKVTRADESILEEMLKDEKGVPFDLGKRAMRRDYYLTDDAKFRLVDLIKSCGIDTEGKKLSACIPELVGKTVLIQITQKASQSGEELFNEVTDLAGESL